MPFFYHGGHLTKDLYGAVPSVINKGGINWLLLDRFTTDRAAGAINGTLSEPSGHVRTLTDSVPNAVITAGQYKITAVAGGSNPWLRYATGWSRAVGRMLRADISANGIAVANFVVGFANTLVTPGSGQTLGVYADNSLVYAGIALVRIGSYTPGTLITIYTILRSTGHFIIINGKLNYIYRAGTTATLYPHANSLAADAAVDFRLDNIGIADLPLTDPTKFPTPTLSDTFSDTVAPLVSDGLAHVEANGSGAGLTWAGVGTFSNLGNKGYITPTPGADLFDPGAGVFTAGTYSWAALGLNTIANDAGELKITYVDTTDGALAYLSNAADLTSDLIVGTFYRFVSSARVQAGNSVTLRLNNGSAALNWSTVTEIALTQRAMTFRALHATLCYQLTPNMGAGEILWLDNQTIQAFPFAQCLRTVAPASASEPYVSAKLTITASTQAGLVINLDDSTTPLNCIHIWCDRVDGKIYARELAAGVWSADKLAGVAFTYSAGAYLEVRRIDDEVYVFYNGAFVGTWTTTLTNANTKVAFFSTDAASYFESVTSYPTDSLDLGAYQ